MKDFDLIVDDGKIFVREYTVTKSMPLTQFAKQLVQVEQSIETPLLPNNCVKFKSDGKSNEYFIHIPMGAYQIKYGRGEAVKTYLVTFPHQIIHFRFNSADPNKVGSTQKLLWCYERDIDFNKSIWQKAAISNIHSDGGFCMGHVAPARTQVGYVNNFLTSFFENSFNDDLRGSKRRISEVAVEQERMYDSDDTDNDIKLAKLWLKGTDINITEKHSFKELSVHNGDY